MQDNFAFPLAEGQLYTSYDLTFKAWEERFRVRDAIQGDVPDPFKRIGVDPYWEYKVPTPNKPWICVDVELGIIVQLCDIHGSNITSKSNRL